MHNERFLRELFAALGYSADRGELAIRILQPSPPTPAWPDRLMYCSKCGTQKIQNPTEFREEPVCDCGEVLWTAGIGHADDPTVRPYAGPVVSRIGHESDPTVRPAPEFTADELGLSPQRFAEYRRENPPATSDRIAAEAALIHAGNWEPCPEDETPVVGTQPDPHGDMLEDIEYKSPPAKIVAHARLTFYRENVIKTAWGNVPQNEFEEGA